MDRAKHINKEQYARKLKRFEVIDSLNNLNTISLLTVKIKG